MMSSPTPPVDPLGDRLMALFWWKPATTLAERTRRRVTVHLIPYLFFLYILAYLDRFNVSVAQLGMKLPPKEQGLGFTDSIVGFGSGLFFWGYWVLEIPSTLSVAKWGARWVFVRILVLWGLCAAMCGLIGLPLMAHFFGWLPQISDPGAGWWGRVAYFISELPTNAEYQFYFFRFMLGFFEGGFFPTVIVYLSYWFCTRDRAKSIASFMVAIPVSGAVGLPFSGLLLNVNWLGLPGWRWIFLLQGIAPVVAGIATIFFLPNGPKDARWLSDEERNWLVGELEAEHLSKKGHGHWAWVHHLGMVLLLTCVYFCLNLNSYGLSMFLPAIVKSQTHATDTWATMIAGFYFTMAAIGMLINGWHSDRTGERPWHVAVPLATLGVATYLAASFDGVPLVPVLIMVFIAGSCMYAHLPAFWPIPTMFLGAAAAASAIGFINMIGNLGGYFGPNLVGNSVTAEISAAQKLIQDPPEKWLTPDEAQPIWERINAATSLEALRHLPDEVTLPADKKLTEAALKPITSLETTMEDGHKLSEAELKRVTSLLSALSVHAPLNKEQQEELISLLGKGASFSPALKKLAPWPIAAAVIILIVGFFRKRAPMKVAPAT